MQFLVKMFLPLIKDYVLKELTKEENRTFVVNKLADHIDIPNLNEEEEKQVVENLYLALTKLLKSYLGIAD